MQNSFWNGYRRVDFDFNGREAILVFPLKEKANGKWMLKTEYFGAFPALELDMLACGYHLAYLKNDNRWGTDADQAAKRDFCEFLSSKYGLSRKCVCIGMSCGGFHAVCFASRYPSYVSLLYLDAPLLSFYGLTEIEKRKDEHWFEEQKAAYGYTTRAELYVNNDQPIHRLKILTDNRIPVALVYGGADSIVDPFSNAEVLKEYYISHEAPIKVWYKPECDHHPHGPENTLDVIEYIRANAL